MEEIEPTVCASNAMKNRLPALVPNGYTIAVCCTTLEVLCFLIRFADERQAGSAREVRSALTSRPKTHKKINSFLQAGQISNLFPSNFGHIRLDGKMLRLLNTVKILDGSV